MWPCVHVGGTRFLRCSASSPLPLRNHSSVPSAPPELFGRLSPGLRVAKIRGDKAVTDCLSPIAAAMRRWRRGSGLDRCGKLLLPPPPPPVVAATAAAAAAAVEAGAAATAASLPQPGLDRCCKPAAVAVVVAAAVVVADTLFPKRGYPPMNCNEISGSERHAQFA